MASVIKKSMIAMLFASFVAVGFQSARGQSGPPPSNINAAQAMQNQSQLPQQSGQPIAPAQNGVPAAPLEPSRQDLHPAGQAAVPGAMPVVPGAQQPANGAAPPSAMNGVPVAVPAQVPPPGAPLPAPVPTPTPAFVPSEVHTVLPAPQIGQEKFAVLKTSMGDIVIKLYEADAPKTVKNFIDLARGDREFIDVKTSKKTKRPFYNGLIFHRVIKDFVIQTGCPFGTGRGGPGYAIDDEISQTPRHFRPGMVGMAPVREEKKGGTFVPNSNGSQFFITLTPQPDFEGKFTIFGEVVKGLEVAKKIGSVKTGPTDRPIKRVYLLSVEIQDGSHDQPADKPAGPQPAAAQPAPPVNQVQ